MNDNNKLTLELGDAFECGCAEWIRAKLPSYEKIWQDFIGHDGKGHPLPIEGLNDVDENRRRRFYQAHYSFAQSAYRLDQLADKASAEVHPIHRIEEFWPYYDQFSLFVTLVGHVCDMFEIMDVELGVKGVLYEEFKEFYAQRSQIMHGPRPPVKFDGTSWAIPAIAGSNEKYEEWASKGTWDSVMGGEFVYVVDYIEKTRKALFELITKKHGAIYDVALSAFKNKISAQKNLIEEIVMLQNFCVSGSPLNSIQRR